ISHFPRKLPDAEMCKSYNRAIADCIDGILEFLILHYYTNTRADTPFWKATKHELMIPDVLRERLSLWKNRLPNNRNINPKYHGFESYSYSVMLLGLGYRPEYSLPVLDHVNDDQALAAFRVIKERADFLCRTLPSQYEYLTTMYA